MLLVLSLKDLRTAIELQLIKDDLIFSFGMQQAALHSTVIPLIFDLNAQILLGDGGQIQVRSAIIVLDHMPN